MLHDAVAICTREPEQAEQKESNVYPFSTAA